VPPHWPYCATALPVATGLVDVPLGFVTVPVVVLGAVVAGLVDGFGADEPPPPYTAGPGIV
jgi:hypothetical protein